jgi:hypothetical protein
MFTNSQASTVKINLLYEVCDVNHVLDLLHKCHMDRAYHWWWFKERIDNERVHEILTDELPNGQGHRHKKM